MSQELHIEQIVLRVPGLEPRRAQRLVDEVMRRVREGLPARFQVVSLGRVEVKLPPPIGLGFDELAERLARAILDQLTPGGAHD
jgi:hypothetical protein